VTEQPERHVATASKARRVDRIFIDWLRNTRGATSIANWSLRAHPGAPTAMPLRWEELAAIRAGSDDSVAAALRRAERLSVDPWAPFAKLHQPVP